MQRAQSAQKLEIKIKQEISKIKQEQLNTYRTHLSRQHKNRKVMIMMTDRTSRDKLKRVQQTLDKVKRARADMNIQYLTYRYIYAFNHARDQLKEKIAKVIVNKGHDYVNGEVIDTIGEQIINK